MSFPVLQKRPEKPGLGVAAPHLPYGLEASPEWKRKSTRQSGGGRKPLSVAFHFLLSLQPQLLVFGCQS